MTDEQIKAGATQWGKWYHAIELCPGFVTDSKMLPYCPPVWENIRKGRSGLDYRGKWVLDIGTMNGMFAFEAEKLGASHVVAVDIFQTVAHYDLYNQFLFARAALKSNVTYVPYGNVHQLKEVTRELLKNIGLEEFDIVQGLGLLYHTEGPLIALQQMRAMCKLGGNLLLESAVWTYGLDEPAMRFNSDQFVYCDPTTFWAPNSSCLSAMLKMSGWSVIPESISIHRTPDNNSTYRVCLVAKAV